MIISSGFTISTPKLVNSAIPDTTSINQTQSVTYTINTSGFSNGQFLYWTNEGTTIASDFSDNANSGYVTINNNSATLTRSLSSGYNTSSANIIIKFRKDSVSGTVLYTASTVTTTFVPDLYYSSVALQLLGEGTLNSTTMTDTSSYAWSISPVTNITLSNTVGYRQGVSTIRFNQGAGAGKYLTTPTNAAFSIGTSGFTVEAWVYCYATTTGYYPIFVSSEYSSSSNSLYIGLIRNTTFPALDRGVQVGTNSASQYLATAYNSWSVNTWFHLAVTKPSGTAAAQIWINGQATGTVGPGSASTITSTTYRVGGGIYDGTSYGFASSYVDFLRFTPGVVRYTNTFTPPTIAGP